MIRYKFIKENQWKDVHQRVQKLNADIASATEFVREIEHGNLDVSIGTEISDSELKTSLVSMRDQMKKYSLTEKQRNWVNEGLAKFVQILRSGNNDGRQQLADSIIRNLVGYLKANQGALFALNDDNPEDIFLELEACYAYDRKKFLEKRIAPGEGLAGQVALEKSTLYMTDVPKDFIKITSGLGEALPRNILLVPLKLDEKIFGVVELASFQKFEPYEIEFVEKLGESIASSIAAVKSSERTETLLKETQLQAEQLKAQEEEVRQNMEELSTTQEELVRKQDQANKLLQKFELVTKTTTEGLWDLEVPQDNNIHDNTPFFWADRFRHMLGYSDERDFPNVLHAWSDLLHPDHKQKTLDAFAAHLYDLSGGTPYDVEYQLKLKDGSYRWFRAIGNTMRDEKGNPLRVAGSLIDIQDMKDIQALQLELESKVAKRTEELKEVLASAQQKNEDLKAQEEELRQNMEELSSTQEAMERAMSDLEMKEAYTADLLNATDDLIYTVDKDFRFVTWNKAFTKLIESLNLSLEKGMNAFEWLPDYRSSLIPLWTRALNGETFQFQWEGERDGQKDHYLAMYSPVRSKTGEIQEAVVFAKNIGQLVEAQHESERHLKEAQQQTEELKAQEEELRQNMEELSATQEAMQRAMSDLEVKEAYASEILNATDDLIYTVDKEFRLITWNKAFARTAEELKLQLEKGMNAFEWWPDYRKSLIPLWTRSLNGEKFQYQWESEREGGKDYYLSIYAPVRSKAGEILEVVVFAKNVGQLVEAQQESARLLKESQQQTEELKAQEEELRQNMEELSATQETMEQKAREVEVREEYLTQLLNTSQDVIFTVDQDFKLVTWNKSFALMLDALGVHPQKGMVAFGWRSDEEQKQFAQHFKRVFRGESFEINVESKFDGTTHHFISSFTPMRNKANEIIEAVVFARDITSILNGHVAERKSSPNKKSGQKKSAKHDGLSFQSVDGIANDSSNGKSHD